MGEYAPHINTPQTAADMNDILEAVGQDDMYYWGFSYGSVLGQTYATLFPERSKRVIIDGVANHFNWYNGSVDESMVDTDSVYDGFISECIRAGPEACPLASRETAETHGQLSKRLMSSIEKLRNDPISVYVNATQYGTVTYSGIWHGAVFPTLYRPPKWSALADNLASLLRGNATPAFLTYAWTDYRAESQSNFVEAHAFVELNHAASGPAHWPQDRVTMLKAAARKLNASMFGETMLERVFLAAKWPVPHGHGFVPARHAKTAHPLLVLSQAHDPITPLASARAANEVFEGSRLVTVLGYGHSSIAVPSLCLARHVRRFLYEGRLPERNEECEVDGNPYFGKGVELRAFEDAEERSIHRAQVELARDLWLRPRRGSRL
jgi:pimeloyl-ACP methyl ester carboxylesterase